MLMKLSFVSIATVLLLTACLPFPADSQVLGLDLTLRPEASGTNVVLASLQLIEREEIFRPDNRLARRIAYVETRDGLDDDTYREGYDGGIWQVDENLFNKTQDVEAYPQLTAYYEQLRISFGVDWPTTRWVDLRRPFFSALGSRLYFSLVDELVPMAGDLSAQGEYWKRHYNSNPEDTVELFVDRVDSFELEGGGACLIRIEFIKPSQTLTIVWPQSFTLVHVASYINAFR